MLKLRFPKINRVNRESTLNSLKDDRVCLTCARCEGLRVYDSKMIVKCKAIDSKWTLVPNGGVCSRWKMDIKKRIDKDKNHRRKVIEKRKAKKEEARAKSPKTA